MAYIVTYLIGHFQEGMLKHLQKSVEEEEQVWKSKMENSDEQLRLAS